MTSTYAGVCRSVPIVPLLCTILSVKAGMVIQRDPSSAAFIPWLSANTPPIGVATGDADLDTLTVAVYVAKGASVQLLCADGIVPVMGDALYFGGLGTVTNVAGATPAFALAIGAGMNGMVEAVIL
jgi:hypothetical protein